MILVPELAEVYVDRHILPGQTAEDAAAQIRAAVRSTSTATSSPGRPRRTPQPRSGPPSRRRTFKAPTN